MRSWGFFCFLVIFCFFSFSPQTCISSVRQNGKVNPGFEATQMKYIDNNGLFLISNSSIFGFGFNPNSDVTSFTLVIIHMTSSTIIWSANRDSPVGNSDKFLFDDDGNAYLQNNGRVVWSTNTANNGVSAMELRDSGNLVLVKNDGGVVWESFSHPTNTLMSNQDFMKGMKLVSNLNNNLSFSLQIENKDLILSAEFKNSQPYWSMGKDKRRIINKSGGDANSATIEANSWRIYDENGIFLSQFVFADDSDANDTWIAVLEDDGFVKFHNLQSQITANPKIPGDSCSRPLACPPYLVCHDGNTCQCPSGLAQVNCKPEIDSSCNKSRISSTLVNAGENLSYFAIGFVSPDSKTDLDGCKSSCLNNCTCVALFFDNNNGNCYMFDQIGSFEDAKNGANIESYVRVSDTQSDTSQGQNSKKQSTQMVIVVVAVVISATFVIIGLVIVGIRYNKKMNTPIEDPDEISEEDHFLENISGMPVRFTYKDLQEATSDFTTKLGHGGFGSVYQEKSDVYSYGMVLLEIISGRKNYISPETSHFPAYASRMMEEGKVEILLDEKMKVDEKDERVVVAIRVALWCIQDDMNLRPSMTKVVRMLEGLCPVPAPPVVGQTGFFSSLSKPFSEFGTSSGPSDGNSDAYLSDLRVSGPR
ncbi:unnamed protein product [Lactuca virosa]|uniref:Receptor-like serine/threonine-protein kinase n=1 Tax=Lactuca virosa TaxID=75947 RepID=A0AAU9PQW1_9ASTR|nr:unnamed protein product [Lactuca virosa]